MEGPPPVTLDAKDAIDIIGQFLDQEWAKLTPEDIEITRLKGGYMNSIHKIERKDAGDGEEPKSVIIRTSGNERSQHYHDPAIREEMMKLTQAEEVLCFREMSRQKQCPRFIGILEGGRVEEFRKMHFITSKEVLMPKYMEDIAKAFARMHTLDLPLSRNRWEPFWKRAEIGYREKPFQSWAKKLADEQGLDFSQCDSIKYHEEVQWLDKIRHKHFDARSRLGLIQADTHYMNLVVNEEPREGEHNVYLLDYELCSYGPRGLDLGAHFFNKAMNFTDEATFLSGEEMHNEEERIKFLKYYQAEIKRLGVKNFDENGLDSIDNLLFESYVGALLYHVFFTYIALNLTDEKSARLHPQFAKFPIIFSKIYIQCKELAIQKYPFLDPKVL